MQALASIKGALDPATQGAELAHLAAFSSQGTLLQRLQALASLSVASGYDGALHFTPACAGNQRAYHC